MGPQKNSATKSTFATVRQQAGKTKGCLSRKTGLAMAFKLMMSAQTKWRKLDGANSMPETVQGVATQRRDHTT
jgi:putative transposase